MTLWKLRRNFLGITFTSDMKRLAVLFFSLLFLSSAHSNACQCPVTQLNLDECAKYDLIFKGKITKIIPCDKKFGEALFEVEELFKGNATQLFTVLFDCNEECAQQLNAGEEWIIYTNYKQIHNAKLDWCSRSRKYFRNPKEDFYAVNYGNDYFEELDFLRTKLGQHRLLADKEPSTENRNKLPDNNQSLMFLLISIAVVVIFYVIFKRFFR
jgi:hypothetical protein